MHHLPAGDARHDMVRVHARPVDHHPPLSNGTAIISNLGRALCIMEHLSTRQEGGPITEIATELSLQKNSVFRIVRTLAVSGYLDEHGKSWRLSPKILSLGYTAVQNAHLIAACMDEMRALRDDINETIFVGALSEGKVVILEELPSFQLVKFTVEIGHKVPIHASAPATRAAATGSSST